jgi:hypothetical protein
MYVLVDMGRGQLVNEYSLGISSARCFSEQYALQLILSLPKLIPFLKIDHLIKRIGISRSIYCIESTKKRPTRGAFDKGIGCAN